MVPYLLVSFSSETMLMPGNCSAMPRCMARCERRSPSVTGSLAFVPFSITSDDFFFSCRSAFGRSLFLLEAYYVLIVN